MGYWSSLGFKDAAASPAVESAAKWVQWAQYGAPDKDQSASVRYNLGQFWTAKAAAYPTALPDARAQLEKLDALAHGIWYAIESGEVYRQGPNFGAWLINRAFGTSLGMGDRDAAAARADAAKAGAAAASQRVGGSWGASMTDYFTARTPSGAQLAAGASSIDNPKGPLGLPWLVWGAAAAIVAGALLLGGRSER